MSLRKRNKQHARYQLELVASEFIVTPTQYRHRYQSNWKAVALSRFYAGWSVSSYRPEARTEVTTLFDMFRTLLFVFGLSQCYADIRVSNANLFMDTLLLGRMPRVAPFEGIEPYKLEPIFVRVNIKNTFGHKFKANFTSSSVTGLSKVKRLDDCARAAIRNGNITIKCNVHFKEVEIILDGFGEGDTTIKRSHRVQAKASFDKTYALIEIAGPERDRPGSLMRFDLTSLSFIIEPMESISLSSDRLAEFKMNLNNVLSDRLKSLLEGKYRTVLENVVSTVNLPPV